MKLLDYVNSRDIREHLIKIEYTPSASESAWLIWQGKNQTLSVKHRSWKELIKYTEDCMIETEFFEIPKVSLSHFVKRYMEIEDMLISAFYKENDNAVSSCRMYFDDDGDRDWYNEPGIFASFDEAYKHALDDGEPPHPNFVEFVKTYIGYAGKQIFMRFNLEKEIVRVDENGYLTDEIDYYIFQGIFKNMNFSFPIPFKKGDIVRTVRGLYTRPSYCEGTFVINTVDDEVNGVMIDDNGNVYHQRVFNYMDLEYVSSPHNHEVKLLNPISEYMRKEIDVAALLNKYRHILYACDANRVRMLADIYQ